MPALRRASFLVRLVLAWFALSLGVAIASPVVKPAGVELICSAGGIVKALAQGDEGGKPVAHHALDCPLCASVSAPPLSQPTLAEPLQWHGDGPAPLRAGRVVATVTASLPARGPPLR